MRRQSVRQPNPDRANSTLGKILYQKCARLPRHTFHIENEPGNRTENLGTTISLICFTLLIITIWHCAPTAFVFKLKIFRCYGAVTRHSSTVFRLGIPCENYVSEYKLSNAHKNMSNQV